MRIAARVVKAVISTIVVLAGLGLVALLVVVPRATGSTALTVLTGSMTPSIPSGSVVLVKPVDPLTLQPGDVITFQTEPGVQRFVTHRVVRFQADTTPPSYVTKGDANRGEDVDAVPIGAIRGEVWIHVPYVGQVSDQFRTPAGYLVLSGVAILLVVAGRLAKRPSGSQPSADSPDEAAVRSAA